MPWTAGGMISGLSKRKVVMEEEVGRGVERMEALKGSQEEREEQKVLRRRSRLKRSKSKRSVRGSQRVRG